MLSQGTCQGFPDRAVQTLQRGPLHTNNEHLGASPGKGRFEALAMHQRSLQSICGFITLQLELSITGAAIAPLGVFL